MRVFQCFLSFLALLTFLSVPGYAEVVTSDNSSEKSFMVALEPCGPIPKCGTATVMEQQWDPIKNKPLPCQGHIVHAAILSNAVEGSKPGVTAIGEAGGPYRLVVPSVTVRRTLIDIILLRIYHS